MKRKRRIRSSAAGRTMTMLFFMAAILLSAGLSFACIIWKPCWYCCPQEGCIPKFVIPQDDQCPDWDGDCDSDCPCGRII